jgi:hypothetical protein
MREWHAVPCINATLPEAMAGRHMTRNDNRICDRCRQGSPVSPGSGPGRGGGSSLPVAASSPPAAFSQDALHARGGGTPSDNPSPH